MNSTLSVIGVGPVIRGLRQTTTWCGNARF